jgi:NADP-dependent 3-hydroxy acid dehydrogenase YdfG
MTKKVICITTVSSDFGFEAVKALAEKGHRVYVGARSLDKMEPLKELGFHILPLNVTDENSVCICHR